MTSSSAPASASSPVGLGDASAFFASSSFRLASSALSALVYSACSALFWPVPAPRPAPRPGCRVSLLRALPRPRPDASAGTFESPSSSSSSSPSPSLASSAASLTRVFALLPRIIAIIASRLRLCAASFSSRCRLRSARSAGRPPTCHAATANRSSSKTGRSSRYMSALQRAMTVRRYDGTLEMSGLPCSCSTESDGIAASTSRQPTSSSWLFCRSRTEMAGH
mmetsp:Transcript_59736/g.129466  ORF Transcript_59736/g.129466 Transcript_59736/m.129466 type:complete len:223 (+) Transcript_59736:978-1646(+)